MKKISWFILYIFLTPILLFPQSEMDHFSMLENKVEELSFLERQLPFELIEEMHMIASGSADSLNLLGRTLFSEALLRERQGMENLNLMEKANRLLQNKGYSLEDEVILKSVLKQIYLSQGDYGEVFTISLELLDLAQQLNDPLWIARTLNTLGIVASKVDQSNLAEEYYKNALTWASSSTNPFIEYNIRSNLWHLYLSKHDLQENPFILDSIQHFLESLEAGRMDGILMINYLNTSNYWSEVGDSDKVFDYLTKAQELCVDNPYYESFILNNLGLYNLYQNDYKSALKFFQQARSTLERYTNFDMVSVVYRNISQVYESQNKPDSALYYIHLSEDVKESMNEGKHVMDILRKYMSTSLEVSENKLALAETNLVVKDKQFVITALTFITLFLLALITIVFFWQKRKSLRQDMLLKEAETKELSIRLETEQAIQKAQADQLEHKLRELTSYSLLLNNKNDVLRQVYNIAKRLPPTEKEIKKEIKKVVDENIQAESDWNDFMLHFDQVHPRFFDKLKEAAPDITPNEIKLAAYIRLGMSAKQIAQMINVVPQSVKMSRHRLRQKLGLDTEQNLDTFIQDL